MLYTILCFLLGSSPASELYMLTFWNTLSVPSSYLRAYDGGTDRVFRNVGIYNSDAGELPKRKHNIFRTRQKFEIKDALYSPFFLFRMQFVS